MDSAKSTKDPQNYSISVWNRASQMRGQIPEMT